MAFHWKIIDSSKIQIGVTVKSNSQGWAGIGFSETGGMKGADVIYYEASTDELVDAHVGDGYMRPTRDQWRQDWSLLSSHVNDGYVLFEAERDLIVADNPGEEDHNIVDDSNIWVANHKIIGAWGNGSTMSFHGNNVVQDSVQLFSDDSGGSVGSAYANFLADMDKRSDGHAILKINNFKVPTDETTYEDVCFSVNDLVDLGLYDDVNSSTHIIGLDFMVDKNTVKYVHHMVLHGQLSSASTDTDSCSRRQRTTIGSWAPGVEPIIFPEGTGFQVGNVANSVNAITINYHFDNVDGDKNIVDNGTGVKIYYTNQKSTIDNEIGMMVIGDGLIGLFGESVGNGKMKHEFSCPSECTAALFGDDEVTVVSEYHHMHAKGKRMVNTLHSGEDGKELNTAILDYYDFDQAGSALVRQKPYQMKRGDYYTTTCYYETNEDTYWGEGSSDEMCMTFAYYYPKQPLLFPCGPNSYFSTCDAQHTKTKLETDSNFGRPVSIDPASASSSVLIFIGVAFLPLVVMFTHL